jgi:DNA repair protein RadC
MAGVARLSVDGSPPPPSSIREMPPEERPRQRLLRSGGESLADPEVLALILGNGCREVCSLELAREILREAGGLMGLVGIRCDALQRRGLGAAKAAPVLAALELARRLVRAEIPRRRPMSHPARVAR